MPPAICPALWSLCCLCLFAFLFVQRRLMKRPIHSERFNEMFKEGAVQCFILCWWKGQSNSNVLINVQRRLLHGFIIICLLMERTIQFEEPTLIILAQGLLVLQQASDDRKWKSSLKTKITFLQTGGGHVFIENLLASRSYDWYEMCFFLQMIQEVKGEHDSSVPSELEHWKCNKVPRWILICWSMERMRTRTLRSEKNLKSKEISWQSILSFIRKTWFKFSFLIWNAWNATWWILIWWSMKKSSRKNLGSIYKKIPIQIKENEGNNWWCKLKIPTFSEGWKRCAADHRRKRGHQVFAGIHL